jgi:hypothetical protein
MEIKNTIEGATIMQIKKFKRLVRTMKNLQVWAYVKAYEHDGCRVKLNKTQCLNLVKQNFNYDEMNAQYLAKSDWHDKPTRSDLGPVILIN